MKKEVLIDNFINNRRDIKYRMINAHLEVATSYKSPRGKMFFRSPGNALCIASHEDCTLCPLASPHEYVLGKKRPSYCGDFLVIQELKDELKIDFPDGFVDAPITRDKLLRKFTAAKKFHLECTVILASLPLERFPKGNDPVFFPEILRLRTKSYE